MIRIANRFCGPPGSANGGYCAGSLASLLDGAVEVTLRKPPPLERSFEVELSDASASLKDGPELVAEARKTSLDLETPTPPSFEQAIRLSRHYVGHVQHHFPTCFVCGPGRAAGDGLRIFPGAEHSGQPVAAPWVPDASLTNEDDCVRPEVVWAALDCVGYFSVAAPDYPVALLGRMTAEVSRKIELRERCVVMGWSLGRDGRKLFAGTAVFGADGQLRARARQTWICLQSEPSSRPSRPPAQPNSSGSGP
jgi:hypothetical protein